MTQERAALAQRINRLEFAEYKPVGWYKVAPFAELLRCVNDDDMVLVTSHIQTPNDPSLAREMIRIFLRNWLCGEHPESIGAWGLEVTEFRHIDRTEALQAVDQIVAASLEVPEARIGGCLEWCEPASPEEIADVPYQQLGMWFRELFGAECRYYLHDSAGGATVRFNVANPRVIGLAPDLIGMLWME